MLSYAMMSRLGNRSQNEDCIRMTEKDDEYLFVLADGLGGHGNGDVASQAVAEQSILTFSETGAGSSTLDKVFQGAQQFLLYKKQKTASDMKTTMVVLQIGKKELQWGHIGDSRLYFFKDEKLVNRTLDHSVPQMLALSGQISEDEIRSHPDRNRVLRVMGTPWEGNSYEVSNPEAVCEKQAFILCTDGFWEFIEEKEMVWALKQSKSVTQWMKVMEQIVLKNGKDKDMDNYSAICVYMDE